MRVVANTSSWTADRSQRAKDDEVPISGENLTEDDPMIAVRIAHGQQLVGFPKFGTWGMGFWDHNGDANCNLPFDGKPEDIWEHIKGNSDVPVDKAEVLQAIELLQLAIPWLCREYGIELSYDPRLDTLRRYHRQDAQGLRL